MKTLNRYLKKMTVLLVLIALSIIISVAGYQYFKVVLSPKYDPDKMTLNYQIVGSSDKNLLVIHGLVGSGNYWKRGLEKIELTHKLYLMDLLGFGDSPKPQSNYSLDVQVKALEKIIAKEGLDDGNTILVAHSLGGIVSLSLMARHPDWFEGAVSIGLPVFTSKDQFIEEMAGHSRFDQLAVGRYGKFICMLRPLYMNKLFKPKEMPYDVFADAKKHTWQSYYNSLNEVILNTDLNKITSNIKTNKLLFIHGEMDKTAPLANVREFAETFTNAEFIEVKDGDHQIFLNDPDYVWSLIQSKFH